MYECPCLMGHKVATAREAEVTWESSRDTVALPCCPSLGICACTFLCRSWSPLHEPRKLQIALISDSFVPLPSLDLITLSYWDLSMMTEGFPGLCSTCDIQLLLPWRAGVSQAGSWQGQIGFPNKNSKGLNFWRESRVVLPKLWSKLVKKHTPNSRFWQVWGGAQELAFLFFKIF